MELKFKAPGYIIWKEATSCKEDNVNGKDGSIPIRNEYPQPPVPYFEVTEGYDRKKMKEFMLERSVSSSKSRANDIIIKDPIPKWVSDTLLDNYDKLEPILKKDSARSFLRLFKDFSGRGMSWNLSITSQILTLMVSHNALRCAKVVLEGKAPELCGMHANPNCISPCGYFPIHEAAERFSCDMIKLLLRHGASVNVRTVGNGVIESLLPLHVAVENTCMHKYLEDNLSPSQNHLDFYIYKLIHLLCLPEMKVFLDTTRLLAEKTNNLLEELWNYIENGKLIQSAVLLLAAQEKIRGGCSSKINGSSKKDGFDIINERILRLSFALRSEKGSDGMAQKLLKERRSLIDCTGLLVNIIARTGEPLSAYIQAHSEVSHVEVLEHVSAILEEHGFYPTGEDMDTINLQPYDCKMTDRKPCSKGLIDPNSSVMESDNLHAAKEKEKEKEKAVTVIKEVGRGWDPTYTKRSFFPYWRSVLVARLPLRVYPAYAKADARCGRLDLEHFSVPRSKSLANALMGRISPVASNHQPKRAFSTAAISAFRLLKMLKYA